MEPRRIPLFPLNTVLFPGMRLPLHIFEPRYQEMIRHCLETDRTFGVCLIREGPEVGGPADPFPVGTTCEIVETETLDGGRMNLVTIGRERFRIVKLYADRPYLEAEIVPYPDEEPGPLRELSTEVHDALLRYVNALLAGLGQQPVVLQLPCEPLPLSQAAGAILQVSLPERQQLLEASVEERLRREAELLRRETGRLEQSGDERSLRAWPFRFDPDTVSPN